MHEDIKVLSDVVIPAWWKWNSAYWSQLGDSRSYCSTWRIGCWTGPFHAVSWWKNSIKISCTNLIVKYKPVKELSVIERMVLYHFHSHTIHNYGGERIGAHFQGYFSLYRSVSLRGGGKGWGHTVSAHFKFGLWYLVTFNCGMHFALSNDVLSFTHDCEKTFL